MYVRDSKAEHRAQRLRPPPPTLPRARAGCGGPVGVHRADAPASHPGLGLYTFWPAYLAHDQPPALRQSLALPNPGPAQRHGPFSVARAHSCVTPFCCPWQPGVLVARHRTKLQQSRMCAVISGEGPAAASGVSHSGGAVPHRFAKAPRALPGCGKQEAGGGRAQIAPCLAVVSSTFGLLGCLGSIHMSMYPGLSPQRLFTALTLHLSEEA